jgi:hypothetical protein
MTSKALIVSAFQWAYDIRNGSFSARELARKNYGNLEFPTLVAAYIYECAPDKRFRLKWHAANTSYRTAIVTYRNARYVIESTYTPPAEGGYMVGYFTYYCD